ncbi:uncharacterized protein LOC106635048 [Pan paniscus]|uniref:uncharacterized protein LOC106635048 n=1 Tax=Pan paniscus TaxID=9597 RepID=UPI003007887A
MSSLFRACCAFQLFISLKLFIDYEKARMKTARIFSAHVRKNRKFREERVKRKGNSQRKIKRSPELTNGRTGMLSQDLSASRAQLQKRDELQRHWKRTLLEKEDRPPAGFHMRMELIMGLGFNTLLSQEMTFYFTAFGKGSILGQKLNIVLHGTERLHIHSKNRKFNLCLQRTSQSRWRKRKSEGGWFTSIPEPGLGLLCCS